MEFEELAEFRKDLKVLRKKYRTLHDDLTIVKQVLTIRPDERPPFSYRIDNLGIKTCVIKVKKIACRSLKGSGVNSGLRLVYAYFSADQRIVFIELYHKGNKTQENRQRILTHFS